MKITEIPFGITDWARIEPTEHKGEKGQRILANAEFRGIRVRMVEYSPDYEADHWCAKGHILLCIEGELETELDDGQKFQLKPGIGYQVSDNGERHKSTTKTGAKLFIVD